MSSTRHITRVTGITDHLSYVGTASFIHSLRNVYFVRERITHDQEELLQQEYISAIQCCQDENERKALKQWAKFSQLYAPYIKKFPGCAYNMAINQVNDSLNYTTNFISRFSTLSMRLILS